MEDRATEISPNSPRGLDVAENPDSSVTEIANHGSSSIECGDEMSVEEIRGALEIIAATGKFWYEWGKLKGMVSFYLHQTLSQYPEAKWTNEQQISALGEAFPELVKRLDDALCSFIEGPPFTLQRLCEILLAATSIYPNLSKLALALEKNLLVTSMLSISTGSHHATSEPGRSGPAETEEKDDSRTKAGLLQNGVQQAVAGDADEIMTEVAELPDQSEVEEAMTMDIETFEDIVRSADANSTGNGDANSTGNGDANSSGNGDSEPASH